MAPARSMAATAPGPRGPFSRAKERIVTFQAEQLGRCEIGDKCMGDEFFMARLRAKSGFVPIAFLEPCQRMCVCKEKPRNRAFVFRKAHP